MICGLCGEPVSIYLTFDPDPDLTKVEIRHIAATVHGVD